MPKVTIVKPINTPEQEKIYVQSIENTMEKIIESEFGAKVKVELIIRH